MKNDKKINRSFFWHQWTQLPHFLKNLFVFIAFFIFFTISIVLIWKRQLEKQTQQVLQAVIEQQTAPKAPSPAPPSPQQDVQSLTDRLTTLEARLTQQQPSLQIPPKLIALELIKGVLEGLIPLDPLKTFLQKTPESWAAPLLSSLASLGDIKDYANLEASLVLPPPPLDQLSLWQRIKRKMKSLVRIQRLDEKGNYKLGKLEDIQQALQSHNLQKALECFEKLPAEDQATLSAWKKMVQDRLFLETTRKTLLLEIAGG